MIFQKLDYIVEQTTETNGTVKKHNKEIEQVRVDLITHPMNCSIKSKVESIEGELLEYKMVKKYPKLFIVGIVVMGLFVVFEVVTKLGIL